MATRREEDGSATEAGEPTDGDIRARAGPAGPVAARRVSRLRRGGASGRGGRRVGREAGAMWAGLVTRAGLSSEEPWAARAVRVGRRGVLLLPCSTSTPRPGVIHLLRCPRDACLPRIGFLIFI